MMVLWRFETMALLMRHPVWFSRPNTGNETRHFALVLFVHANWWQGVVTGHWAHVHEHKNGSFVCPIYVCHFLTLHLEVGVSSVVVMTPMHGENLLKKQTNTKFFYFNLESKNLSMHWRHHLTNSRQITSELFKFVE